MTQIFIKKCRSCLNQLQRAQRPTRCKKSLLGELRPTTEKLLAIAFPQLQAISAPPGEGEDLDTSGLFIGTIAVQYLRQFTSQQEVDKAFGIYEKDGKFYTVYQKTSTFLFFK